MKVNLNQIKETETQYHFTEKDRWVAAVCLSVDETDELVNPDSARLAKLKETFPKIASNKSPGPRPLIVDFTTRKVDDVFMVQGKILGTIRLLCSRCANTFELPIQPRFSTVFTQETPEDRAYLEKNPDPYAYAKPNKGRKGYARHAHEFDEDADPTGPATLATETIDTAILTKEFIDLEEILAEQMQLQVPFQPLCHPECKGICPHCGTDLNAGRCACKKLVRESPFSVLKDLSQKRTLKEKSDKEEDI